MQYLSIIILVLAFLISIRTQASACDTNRNPSASATVKNADVIVRATAIEFIKDKGVKFRVEEVLKGEDVASTFIFTGHLTERDDFNKGSIPYNHVRSSGHGPCNASEYKQNAEYLFMLKQIDNKLTPYWFPLAPNNEQLRSKDDEWLKWVKDYLQSNRKQ
ncbi:MAG TPA: hypothetical protein VF644_15265 [Pyrinomonadaceae bacterium]|jgi:hypothetical protein